MSAIAAFAESDRIHLLADGAFYDTDGVLTDIRMKIWQIPGTQAVFSSRGSEIAFPAFALAAAGGEHSDFDGLVSDLDAVWSRFDDLMAGEPGEMVLAGWSKERRCPVVLFRHTIVDGPGPVDCAPGVTYILPGRSGFGIDFNDLGDAWNEGCAVAAFERARALRYDVTYGLGTEPVMRHAIGGHIVHAEVSASGIRVETIRHWSEDVVGAHIQPSASIETDSLAEAA